MPDKKKPGHIVNPETGLPLANREPDVHGDLKPIGLSKDLVSHQEEQIKMNPDQEEREEVSFHSDKVKYRAVSGERSSKTSVIFWILGVVSCLTAFWLMTDPRVPGKLQNFAARSIGLINQHLPGSEESDRKNKAPQIDIGSRNLEGLSCGALIQKALSLKVKGLLSDSGVLNLASCYLFQNSASSAENVLGSYKNPVMSETGLRTGIASLGYHLYLDALMARWKFGAASEQAFLNCRGWQWTSGCVGKLMVHSRTSRYRDAERGFQNLRSAKKGLDVNSQVRVYISGGIASRKIGRFKAAFSRLEKASQLLGRKDRFLVRQVLVEQMKVAYFSKDSESGKKIYQEYRKMIPKNERRDYASVDILYGVQKRKFAKKALKLFFSKRSMYQRFIDDPEIVAILSYEGIRVGLAAAVEKFLTFVKDHMIRNHELDENYANWISLWKVRAQIAQEKYDTALVELSIIEQKTLKTPEYYFLKGLAYLSSSEIGNHKILAVNEFQKVINLSNEWQGYYGAVMGLLPSKNAEKMNLLFKSWPGIGPQKEGRRWYMFSRLKAAIALNDKQAARRLAQRLLKEYPDFRKSLEFLQVYFGDIGDTSSQKNAIDLLQAFQKDHSSEGSIDNPLNPLVLPVFSLLP